MRTFDAATTCEALSFDRLIPALRSLFASGCTVPKRHVHEIVNSGGLQFTSLIMPAWLEGHYYGIKTINIANGNAKRGLPGLHASYVLYDGLTGVPLALIDGDQITTRRTAAASALAAQPVIEGRWLQAGSHLDLIGSFTPAMREADDDCLMGASLFVDTEEAFEKSGDLLGPIERGVLREADLCGTLSTLSRGEAPGRRAAEERTVFKAVGTALEDLAAAIQVFESSRTGSER